MPYLEVDTLLFVVYCMYLLGTYLPIIYLYCPEGTSFNIYHTQRELGLSKASPSLQRVPKTSHMRERTAMPILDETLMPIDGLIFTFVILSLVLSKGWTIEH